MKTNEYKKLRQKKHKSLEDKCTLAYYHPDGDGVI